MKVSLVKHLICRMYQDFQHEKDALQTIILKTASLILDDIVRELNREAEIVALESVMRIKNCANQ